MTTRHTLGKTERLKSRKAIEQLFREGKSFSHFPFRVYFQKSTPATNENLQWGVGVSSRNFKRAVDRNRIKRLLRESWRLQKHTLNDFLKGQPYGLQVFFIFTGKEIPEFEEMQEKTAKVIERFKKMLHENPESDT